MRLKTKLSPICDYPSCERIGRHFIRQLIVDKSLHKEFTVHVHACHLHSDYLDGKWYEAEKVEQLRIHGSKGIASE